MKLSDFFPASNKISEPAVKSEGGKTDSAAAARINRQIQSLAPGKLIKGEVVERNGDEVRIKLSDDLVMTARLDQDVSVEEGRILTFQVKNNGASLILNPLFTNTAASDNVMKALQMANLPVNNTTVAMTEQMMQQGMSVDTKALQNVFRDIASHAGAAVEDIVLLHKLALPVDEGNLQQMENYRELTHQLVSGMTDVLQELVFSYGEIAGTQGEEQAAQMLRQILQLFVGEGENLSDWEAALTGRTDVTENAAEADASAAQAPEAGTAEKIAGEEHAGADGEKGLEAPAKGAVEPPLSGTPEGGAPEEVTAKETPVREMPEDGKTADVPTKEMADGEMSGKEMQGNPAAKTGLSAAFTEREPVLERDTIQKLLKEQILKNWCIKPEDGLDAEKVDRVYRQMKHQLSGLENILQEYGAEKSSAMKSVLNMCRNIDFIEQINQMYTYVQLPLKMEQRQANGELYVFTNKRSLAKKEGAVSALLHLDMENLGPVDVYVAMQENRVTTRFQVQDDAMLTFLNDHMHILTERLSEKGYEMKCEMSVRNGGEQENPVEQLLQREKGSGLMMQYGFDVRA